MDCTMVSKHLVAIDGLNTICNKVPELVQSLQNAQNNEQIDTKGIGLIDPLRLLSKHSSQLKEHLRHEVSRSQASVCAVDGLNECTDLCGEALRLLCMLKSIIDEQGNHVESLSALQLPTADEGQLKDLTNNFQHMAGRMNVFTHIFALARELQDHNLNDCPTPARKEAVKQTCLQARTALVDLVRKVEEVDSMIGKLPPACETYLKIDSYIADETEEKRDSRIQNAAATMVEVHLRSWTKVPVHTAAILGKDVFAEALRSTSKLRPSDQSAIVDSAKLEIEDLHDSVATTPGPSMRRVSSTASGRLGIPPGAKSCLRRKKVVTWDPHLFVKGDSGSQSTDSGGAQEEAPPTTGLSKQAPTKIDSSTSRALDAIASEYRKLLPHCLELLDPTSALVVGYSHEREYRRLSDSLMTVILEKLDNLSIAPQEESNRRKRKELATDASKTLQEIDAFMMDYRRTTPPPRKTNGRSNRHPTTTTEHQKPPEEARSGSLSSSPSPSRYKPCLGYKSLPFTPRELYHGCYLTIYIPHTPSLRPPLQANFYIRVPPASMPGDHIHARLLYPGDNIEQSQAYYDIELTMAEPRRRSRSSRARRNALPDVCLCEKEAQCYGHVSNRQRTSINRERYQSDSDFDDMEIRVKSHKRTDSLAQKRSACKVTTLGKRPKDARDVSGKRKICRCCPSCKRCRRKFLESQLQAHIDRSHRPEPNGRGLRPGSRSRSSHQRRFRL